MFGILLEKIMPRKEHYNSDNKPECESCHNYLWSLLGYWLTGSVIAVILSLKYCKENPKKNKIIQILLAFFTSYIYIFVILYKMFYSGKYTLTKIPKAERIGDSKTVSSITSSDSVLIAAPTTGTTGTTIKPATGTTIKATTGAIVTK